VLTLPTLDAAAVGPNPLRGINLYDREVRFYGLDEAFG
jgi:hypothetical protein